jgi:hypothetical protein
MCRHIKVLSDIPACLLSRPPAGLFNVDTKHSAPHGILPDAAVGTEPHLTGANSMTIVNI